jgi:hypothetical protein
MTCLHPRELHDSYVQNYLNTGIKKIIRIGRKLKVYGKMEPYSPQDSLSVRSPQ